MFDQAYWLQKWYEMIEKNKLKYNECSLFIDCDPIPLNRRSSVASFPLPHFSICLQRQDLFIISQLYVRNIFTVLSAMLKLRRVTFLLNQLCLLTTVC